MKVIAPSVFDSTNESKTKMSGGSRNDGWNDPPMLSFNPSSVSSPPRTQLNKRVGFPLTSNSPNQQGKTATGTLLGNKSEPPKLPPVHILPPSVSTGIHPPLPLLLSNLSPPVDPSSLPPSFALAARDPHRSETMPELLERLNLESADALRKYTKKILHEMVDECQDSIQGRSREDVQARLGLLDDQWRDQKLSEEAKVKLGCLACALKNNDVKHADSLHLALMVDHISEVSQWMVGVKRLINELKLRLVHHQPPPTNPTTKLFSPGVHCTPLPSEFSPSALDSLSQKEQKSCIEDKIPLDVATPATTEDVCISAEKLASMKPVMMPEALISGLESLKTDETAAETGDKQESGDEDATKPLQGNAIPGNLQDGDSFKQSDGNKES